MSASKASRPALRYEPDAKRRLGLVFCYPSLVIEIVDVALGGQPDALDLSGS